MLTKETFEQTEPIAFNEALAQNILDIEDKNRANIFAWRGQFSPQLIENLILSYCPRNAAVLDPFSGSGTVLYESAYLGLQAFGYEVNPAAWILSRTYELTNIKYAERKEVLEEVLSKLKNYFPEPKALALSDSLYIKERDFKENIYKLCLEINSFESILLDTLIILLNLANNNLTKEHLYNTFFKLSKVIRELPFLEKPIQASMSDARNLPLKSDKIDFIITSPPYINVFNYHQNYRRSAEALGWDLLKIAKSEIGSNRANRGNRFFTVVQYCLDMAAVLREMQRVTKKDARIIFVVGRESKVLGVPCFNAEIISNLCKRSNCFGLGLRQTRKFKNKFGNYIWEDLLHLSKLNTYLSVKQWDEIARDIALEVLSDGLTVVSQENRLSLEKAIEKIPSIKKTPLYNNQTVNSN